MAKNKRAKANDGLADEEPRGGGEARGLGLADGGDNLVLRDDAELSSAARGDDRLPRGNQGDESRPYCGRHNVLMISYGTRPLHTDYRCPVEGCDSREKRVRPKSKIPSQPQLCPQRTCVNIALEVVPAKSNAAQLHMQCPQCRFHVKVPRPQFGLELARQRRRGAVDDLAAR